MSQLIKTKRQTNLKDFIDLEPLRGSSNKKKNLYSTTISDSARQYRFNSEV
jgi:hypothetical protein